MFFSSFFLFPFVFFLKDFKPPLPLGKLSVTALPSKHFFKLEKWEGLQESEREAESARWLSVEFITVNISPGYQARKRGRGTASISWENSPIRDLITPKINLRRGLLSRAGSGLLRKRRTRSSDKLPGCSTRGRLQSARRFL